MKKKFTFLIAALMLLTMINLPGKAVGQSTTYSSNVTLPSVSSPLSSCTVKLNAQDTGNPGIKIGTSSTKTGSFDITVPSGTTKLHVHAAGWSGKSPKLTVTTKASGVTITPNTDWSLTADDGISGSGTTYTLSTPNNAPTSYYKEYTLSGVTSATTITIANKTERVVVWGINYEIPAPTPTTYTVSFNCDGGTANCPDDIEDLDEGDDFTIPSTAPTRDCYTFGGWFDGEMNEYVLGQTYQCPASDLTLTADWTLNKYTVTYYSNNGETGEDVADDNLECGSAYTIADDPGFTPPTSTPNFVNWNTQANGQGTTYTVGQGITISGNLDLYAQWSANPSYAVTFNCNGDNVEGCPANMNVEAGTQITLPDAPTREGYTFNCGGWWNMNDNSRYAPGSPYVVNAAVTFRADWIENQSAPAFTVTGVSNGTADTYYATASVSINTVSGYTYYYTTNGDEPTTSSTEYTSAIVVNTTGSTTIKAIATQYGCTVSPVGTKTITIVQPNEATFTNGVYSESFSSLLGLWYAYNVTGDKVWAQGSVTASQVTYTGANINGYQENNEDWLISPKMTAENGKVVVSFSTVARYYSSNYTLVVKYSTNYNGYGAPSGATWKALNPTIATAPNSGFSSWTESGNVVISELSTSTDPLTNSTPIHVAFVYTSATGSGNATQYVIKNFSAKQCYPITYYANGGSGSTTDSNSPYAVGAEVTILDNSFTAPSGKEFTNWNTNEGGTGESKNPGQKITMITAGYELYAQWGDACVLAATMNATTGAAAYNYNGGNKRFDINLSSSVKTPGGCDIYDYGFVYSTIVTTPTVDGSDCTKVQVGDSQPTFDDPFVTTIEGATLGETYYVCSYATNNAGTAYSDVHEVEVPANFDNYKYEISYTTNGTAEASTYVYQGAPISGLATPTGDNIPAGYTFMGWYGDDYALNNTAPAFVKNGDAINSDLALKAVFAIQTSNVPATLTKMVTGDNFAKDDKVVVVAAVVDDVNETTDYYGMYQETSGTTYVKNYSFTESVESVAADDKNWWTVTAGQTNGKWVLGDATNGYLYNSSNNNLAASTDNSTEWSLVDNEDGTFGLNNGRYVSCRDDLSGDNQYLYRMGGAGPSGVYKFTIYKFVEGSISYADYCTSVSGSDAITVVGGSITNNELTGTGTIAANTAVSITSLTIKKNAILIVNGVIATDNPANLIIEDGGQLILTDANTNVQATVQKEVLAASQSKDYIAPFGWYSISSSVNNAKIAGEGANTNLITTTVEPFDFDLYRYNETVDAQQWENYRANDDFTHMTNGRGYLYRNANSVTIEFTGTVNTGDVEYTVTKSDVGTLSGFNLIGNPYTHDIYKGTGGAIVNSVENGYELATGYYVATHSGAWEAKADNTDPIVKNQGILVQAVKAGTITMTNTLNGYISPSAKANHDNIKFMVSNSQYEDVAYAMFDKGNGLNKISHRNAEIPMLYIPQNDENYAIAMMSDDTQSFGLNFKAMTMGKYTLSYKADGQFSYLHVIDRLTGEDVDMLLEESYSFVGTPKDAENRFIVKLNYQSSLDSSENSTFAYQSGNDIIVSGEGTLQIFDVMGRMIATQNINGVETVNVPANGVYVFRLNEKVQKVVVK